MPKCMPIDTNQVNPTKIIDGWQVLKIDISKYKQLLPKMQLCKMAELKKRKRNPSVSLLLFCCIVAVFYTHMSLTPPIVVIHEYA